MNEGHKFSDHVAARKFILAGNAIITLRSEKTGTRYTFKVQKHKTADLFFVKHLYGPDNLNDYAYLGIIKENGMFSLSAKTAHMSGAAQYRAFQYMWSRLHIGIANDLEIWHEGRCGRCNRTLTVPESIESGFGPECINYV